MLVVSAQYGMGSLWYPTPYRVLLGKLLATFDYRWGGFRPLVSRRDRDDEYAYKGPVYADTIYNV